MQAVMRRQRDTAVDFIKTFAILGVALIHAATGATSNPLGSAAWYSALLWGSVSRASVPLFLMCSGVLFLTPERELPLKKLFSRYILRILAALFCWAALYEVYHMAAARDFSLAAFVAAGKDLVLFRHEFHLYYLHIILLVYAFLPLTRLLVRHADKRQLEYLLALWFVLGILYPTLRPFWPFTRLGGIPAQWLMNMTYASIGYGVLGYYLRRYPIRRSRALVLLAAGFAVVFGGTVLLSLRRGTLFTQFWEGMSVGVCLQAAGIFALFSAGRNPRPTVAKAVCFCSKASFCVYLCHVLFLYVLQSRGLSANWPIPALGITLLAAASVAGSVLVYLVLSRIPLVRSWLI